MHECTKSCALPCGTSACASKKRTCSCPNLVDQAKLCGVHTSSYIGHDSFAVEGLSAELMRFLFESLESEEVRFF
jgi:hypothetical protein